MKRLFARKVSVDPIPALTAELERLSDAEMRRSTTAGRNAYIYYNGKADGLAQAAALLSTQHLQETTKGEEQQ